MFPERMRALRMGRGLTLEQLAQELNEMNVSYNQKKNTRSQLSKWECGVNTPTYLDIRQLAEFLTFRPTICAVGQSKRLIWLKPWLQAQTFVLGCKSLILKKKASFMS